MISATAKRLWTENVIREWLSRDENGDMILDREKISAYVAALGEKYNTPGLTRTFETYDNREITVSGGDYGWVIDEAKETDALYQAVTDRKTQVPGAGISAERNEPGH